MESLRSDEFKESSLYRLLSNNENYSLDLVEKVNSLLHEQPELAELTDKSDGSFFHLVSRRCKGNEK